VVTRQQIINYARTLKGTPFHHQGRLPGVGLDCIGVLTSIAQRFDLTFHDHKGYSPRPDGITLLREFRKCLIEIPSAKVQPGDILTFWCNDPQRCQHTALATDLGLLHSVRRSRAVIEHGMDDYWQERLVTCFKFPNIDPTPYDKLFKWWKPTRPVADPKVILMVERQIEPFKKGCCG
jgi:cell wall-associated NlpC family hydrolase